MWGIEAVVRSRQVIKHGECWHWHQVRACRRDYQHTWRWRCPCHSLRCLHHQHYCPSLAGSDPMVCHSLATTSWSHNSILWSWQPYPSGIMILVNGASIHGMCAHTCKLQGVAWLSQWTTSITEAEKIHGPHMQAASPKENQTETLITTKDLCVCTW